MALFNLIKGCEKELNGRALVYASLQGSELCRAALEKSKSSKKPIFFEGDVIYSDVLIRNINLKFNKNLQYLTAPVNYESYIRFKKINPSDFIGDVIESGCFAEENELTRKLTMDTQHYIELYTLQRAASDFNNEFSLEPYELNIQKINNPDEFKILFYNRLLVPFLISQKAGFVASMLSQEDAISNFFEGFNPQSIREEFIDALNSKNGYMEKIDKIILLVDLVDAVLHEDYEMAAYVDKMFKK